MNVETIDAGIWSSARAAGELQATVLGWFPLYADADNQMYTYYYSEMNRIQDYCRKRCILQ